MCSYVYDDVTDSDVCQFFIHYTLKDKSWKKRCLAEVAFKRLFSYLHDLTFKHLSKVRLAYPFSFHERTITLFICHCLLWWKVTFLRMKRYHLIHSTVISSGIFTTNEWIHLEAAKHHHLHWTGTYSRFQCCRKLNKLSYNLLK